MKCGVLPVSEAGANGAACADTAAAPTASTPIRTKLAKRMSVSPSQNRRPERTWAGEIPFLTRRTQNLISGERERVETPTKQGRDSNSPPKISAAYRDRLAGDVIHPTIGNDDVLRRVPVALQGVRRVEAIAVVIHIHLGQFELARRRHLHDS